MRRSGSGGGRWRAPDDPHMQRRPRWPFPLDAASPMSVGLMDGDA